MIRDAGTDDAAAIAEVFSAAWEQITPALDPADRTIFAGRDLTAMWRGTIRHPNRRVLLRHDEQVQGFVVTARTGELGAPLHVRSLYVHPHHGRRGVGAALLSAAVADQPAWLTVFEPNTAARSFYRRNGWHDAGPVDDQEGFSTPLRRMERTV